MSREKSRPHGTASAMSVPPELPRDRLSRMALLSRLFELADMISANGPEAVPARTEMRAILALFSANLTQH